MIDWFIARLKEKTTWLGLVGLLATLGVGISSDMSDSIVNAGMAIGALVSSILVAVNTTTTKE